jgi:hypothetical protein
MAAFFRTIRQRQQHISYFVICFLLFALALALAKAAGWWAVIALWIVLVGLLELVYRWTVALGYRNRRTWWAKRQSHNYWFVFRWALYLGIAFAVLMVRHVYFRYAFLALVVAGLLCAVIIRRMGRRDQA